MVLSNCEFFCYEDEIWLRTADGNTRRISESDTDIVRELDEKISMFYPGAHAAMREIYKASSANIHYYRWRCVARFIRCNMSNLDHVPDVGKMGEINLEIVTCPMRGECRHDGIICRPAFNSRLSPAESRVMRLLYDGASEDAIADNLCLSVLTVRTHIRNACSRLGLHSRAAFMKYAAQNKIFDGEI